MLGEYADDGALVDPLDKVALPAPWYLSVLNLGRTVLDAQLFRYEAAFGGQRGAPPTTLGLVLAHRLDHCLLERSAGLGVDAGMMVSDALLIGKAGWWHVPKSDSNLQG